MNRAKHAIWGWTALTLVFGLSLVPAAELMAQSVTQEEALAPGQIVDSDETTAAPDTPSELATDENAPSEPAVTNIVTPTAPAATTTATASSVKDPQSYDLWVLLPAAVAILLAIFTRQVVPALVVAIFVGAYMLVPCLATDDPLAGVGGLIAGFRLACERYALGAITDTGDGYGHIKIMIFTLVIGFTVGVIGRNGGTAGMVGIVTGKQESPRRSALTAWFAGLVVFFDDYANTMIVGPAMRSVFDRVRISRAKLAYIIDSTAAPVASIALIGTWVGAEIGYIQDGIDQVSQSGAPAFLLGGDGQILGGMQAFLHSLPYRFYPILALFLVFLVAYTGRDFGPMKRSQRQAAAGKGDMALSLPDGERPSDESPPRWWLGLFPIAALVVATIGVLIVTGLQGTDSTSAALGASWWQNAATIISNADSYVSIFYGAIASALIAVVLTLFARTCSTRDAVEAGLDGMARMFPAVVILVLAWALSAVLNDLHLSDVAVAHLRAMEFPAMWLPLAVFICAAIVSFATGSSWGTMGILCPATVSIAANLGGSLDPAIALHLFYASVGSVLAGAIFGDHCSPISDTTVLSSIAAGCPHEEHVWTQIPYALVAAVAAMGFGDVMCSVFDQPWYLGLAAGAVFLWLFVLIVGRRATLTPETIEA